MSRTFLCVIVSLMAAVSCADVELAALFGDHMVLQRESNVPIWGTADAGEDITVAFNGQTVSAKAGSDGRWEAVLEPMVFGGPFELTVLAKNKVVLTDILVGDVWLFGGQSNAPWGVNTSKKAGEAHEMADKCPQVRHSRLAYQFALSEYPVGDFPRRTIWYAGAATNISAGSPSFFLPKIHLATGIPQGFLMVARAGTSIEPWISLAGYDSVNGLEDIKKRLELLRPDTDAYRHATQTSLAYVRKWLERATKLSAAGQPVPELNIPARVPCEQAHMYPTYLYNGCFAPMAPMAIKGVFWYQGESNVGDLQYREKLVAFSNGLRLAFRNPKLPFLLVQPCPYKGYGEEPLLPILWEQQQDFADSDGNAYVCVTSDIGDVTNWHPREKYDIPCRMANLALKYVYGKRDIKADFPRFDKLAVEGNKLVLSFTYAVALRTRDGKAPTWFELAGTDGKYYPATAVISGNKVVLSSGAVKAPAQARFAWSNIAEPNLHNEVELPPYAFRTDRGPGMK